MLCAMMAFSVALIAQAVPQFEKDYQPVACSGPVPSDIVQYCSGNVKKCDENYRSIFSSGLILYGTPLNRYVDAVADRVLASAPELRKKLRFYVMRSTDVNACAYENGVILVNTGLLAQLQNESELAFILAHEVIHIEEGHIQAEREAAKKEKRKVKNSDGLFTGLTAQTRSREHETEADRLAFSRYFSKTSYSYEALDGVFDVLQYSYLPFDEIPFTRRFVEAACYHFPDEYFLAAVTPVRAREDYVDTLSSHPNLKKRREWVRTQVAVANNSGRSEFLQSEALFREIRDMARFECIDLWLTHHEFADAFYNSYVMAQSYPDNRFLRRAFSMALYGIAKHKENSQLEDVVPRYKEVEGEKQQMCHFFYKCRQQELFLLALRFAWIGNQRDSGDTFSRTLTDRIIYNMLEDNKLNYNNYSDYPMDYIPTPIEQAEQQSAEAVSGNKYDRLRQSGANRQKVQPTEKFTTQNYMLADLRENPAFWNRVDSVHATMEDDEVMGKITSVRNPELGKPLVIWKPVYFKLRLGAKSYVQKGEGVGKVIRRTCKRLKIGVSEVNTDSLLLSSAEGYNHYCKLQNWYYDYLSSSGTKMMYYQSEGIGDACKAAGSENFCLFHAYSYPDRFIFRYIWYPFIAAALVPLATPVAAAHFFAFEYDTKAGFSVINMPSSNVLYNSSLDASAEQTDAYIHDFIYQSLNDVKTIGK